MGLLIGKQLKLVKGDVKMKYYINVADFENNRLYLSPDGVTTDALKDGLEWDYIPTIDEVKKIYGQG